VLQKGIQKSIRKLKRRGESFNSPPIHKVEIFVLKTGTGKPGRIVNLHIQPNDCGHIVLFEIIEVGFGGVQRIAVVQSGLGVGATKCDELVGHNPIEISVFHALVKRKVIISERVIFRQNAGFHHFFKVY
jgi:hypothetical protein